MASWSTHRRALKMIDPYELLLALANTSHFKLAKAINLLCLEKLWHVKISDQASLWSSALLPFFFFFFFGIDRVWFVREYFLFSLQYYFTCYARQWNSLNWIFSFFSSCLSVSAYQFPSPRLLWSQLNELRLDMPGSERNHTHCIVLSVQIWFARLYKSDKGSQGRGEKNPYLCNAKMLTGRIQCIQCSVVTTMTWL